MKLNGNVGEIHVREGGRREARVGEVLEGVHSSTVLAGALATARSTWWARDAFVSDRRGCPACGVCRRDGHRRFDGSEDCCPSSSASSSVFGAGENIAARFAGSTAPALLLLSYTG
jgi:hypothetical protein